MSKQIQKLTTIQDLNWSFPKKVYCIEAELVQYRTTLNFQGNTYGNLFITNFIESPVTVCDYDEDSTIGEEMLVKVNIFHEHIPDLFKKINSFYNKSLYDNEEILPLDQKNFTDDTSINFPFGLTAKIKCRCISSTKGNYKYLSCDDITLVYLQEIIQPSIHLQHPMPMFTPKVQVLKSLNSSFMGTSSQSQKSSINTDDFQIPNVSNSDFNSSLNSIDSPTKKIKLSSDATIGVDLSLSNLSKKVKTTIQVKEVFPSDWDKVDLLGSIAFVVFFKSRQYFSNIVITSDQARRMIAEVGLPLSNVSAIKNAFDEIPNTKMKVELIPNSSKSGAFFWTLNEDVNLFEY